MKQIPKISIIIPLYNAPIDYFRDCLQSIADQKMDKMIEVIIIDDCSTINYSEIYNDFLNLNLTILKPEVNSGPGVCRHMGVDKAKGKYISFMDADDRFYDSTSLSRMYKLMLEHPTADIVCGQTVEELEDGTTFLHQQNYIWCFAKIFKTAFLRNNNINFNDSRANEDNSFCTLCSICTDNVFWLLEPVYFWRFQPTSITRENNHEYHYSGFKSYVENMIWVYNQCVERGIEKKNKCTFHCIAVWLRIYFHFLDVFQHRGEEAAMEVIKWGSWFYDEALSNVDEKSYQKQFMDVYKQAMTSTALVELMTTTINVSYPEFDYRARNKDYSEFNQNYDYYIK